MLSLFPPVKVPLTEVALFKVSQFAPEDCSPDKTTSSIFQLLILYEFPTNVKAILKVEEPTSELLILSVAVVADIF